ARRFPRACVVEHGLVLLRGRAPRERNQRNAHGHILVYAKTFRRFSRLTNQTTEEPDMKTTADEKRVAEEIVEVMGAAVRVCSDDRDTVRFAVRAEGLAL